MIINATLRKVFLFSECYLRICNDVYDLGDLENRQSHISNWQVNKTIIRLKTFKHQVKRLFRIRSFHLVTMQTFF